MGKKHYISKTSAMHIAKLIFRSALFLTAAAIYIYNRVKRTGSLFGGFENRPVILFIIWCVFVVEMLLRFFPSRIESMGCQKQFSRNYKPTGADKTKAVFSSDRSVLAVAASWIGLNLLFGALYIGGIFDAGIMMLISLAYSVCDLICILFFCPFQTWFMKNKCCGSCRIYNWDYAMMFTPLIFVKGFLSRSLLILAVAMLIEWEVLFFLHPERFSDVTNSSLACANCHEKLCSHKTQLKRFLKEFYKGADSIPGLDRDSRSGGNNI